MSDLSIQLPEVRAEAESVFHLYVLQVGDRQGLLEYLKGKDIQAGVHYPVPVHLQPAYQDRVLTANDMSITENLTENIISLPMYPELSVNDAKKIVDVMKKFLD